MQCPECQFDNREGVKFCEECGTEFELECPACKANIPFGRKFCGQCGYDLNFIKDSSNQISETDSLRSLSSIEESTRDITPIVGERKHVTALFSDLSGYTAMTEILDPEDVKEITSRIFDGISKIISKYDGFIEKFAGDAVMALFGAEKTHEDDPVRAILAARKIHNLVNTISPDYEKVIEQPLSMHTGINTGLVVTGEVNLEKGVHGMVGDTINVAARLSAEAKVGDILVDHETFSRTEGYFQFENLEPVQLKGKTNVVQVHRYLAVKEHPQKIHRLHGLRAELIGRKAEMTQLSEAVENIERGQGAVFSIIGAAGTGKSRLVEEFKASLNLKEIQWREGQAFPYAQNIPYFPLIDLISKTIRIDEGDSPDRMKEKLESSLDDLIGQKQDITPYIGSLYALDYPEIDELSPEFYKTELQKAILIVLTALARRAPTVICIEDLHWADPSTIKLVHFLLSEIRYPALFLCVYRPTISPFSTHQIETIAIPHQEIHLRELSPSESQSMVESLLKTDTIPKELQRFIENKVEGNPFYLEEAINSLIESNFLVSENDGWKISGPVTESEISATIQGVISARVDRLDQGSKQILQEASVIGRSFYYDIVKKITELKDNIDKCLSGLERFDLIKTKSIQPYLEYIFKHALTQEVVYNGLLKKERREIHERIGYVIEELFKDRLPEFYETLAFHFKNGHSNNKAVPYLMKSGEKSLKRYAVEESHQYYKEAFELLKNRPKKSYEDNKLLIDILINWAYVFFYRGDFNGLRNILTPYENIAFSINDKARIGMYLAWLGVSFYNTGEITEAYEILHKALKIGEEIQNEKVIGFASTLLIWTCKELGNFEEALSHGKRAQEISKLIDTDRFLYSTSLAGVAHTYVYMAEFKKIIEISKTLIAYGQNHMDIRSEWWGQWLMGFGYLIKGDFSAATKCGNKATQLSIEPIFLNMSKLLFARMYILEGNFKKAEKELKNILKYCEKFGDGELGLPAYLFLGVVLIAQGQMSQGLKMIQEVQIHCKKNQRKTIYALTEYFLGKIYLQMVERSGAKSITSLAKNLVFLIKNVPLAGKRAEEHLKNALEVSKEIGAKSYIAMVSLDLGILHKANKRTDEARKCIAEAIKILETCEAERYLKQANEVFESLG